MIVRTVFLAAGLAASLTASPGVAATAEEVIAGEILIETNALRPEVFMTEPERRVLFVNRSGRSVHIQFSMKNEKQHYLIQAPEQIWSVFHQMGRHPFVVHFLDRTVADLHGAVEVASDPHGRPDPLTCSGITVMGACLER